MRYASRVALLASTFLLTGGSPAAGATCGAEKKPDFVVAIDVGHTRRDPGAISARGRPEYHFNMELAALLHRELVRRDFTGSFLIDEGGTDIELRERAKRAHASHADLLISVHHDSVQPHYLSTWTWNGEEQRYADRFRGYSLFYSERNAEAAASLAFARAIGTELIRQGFSPSLHHAEPIEGENRDLVDAERGIYRFDDLIVLHGARMPALLFEAGIIVNRDEELRLTDGFYRAKLVAALVRGIEQASCAS